MNIIKCKAAIAWSPGAPLKIEDIEVDPPKSHEIRVKILFTGVCHTDYTTMSGNDNEGKFPVILGHEGAGIVESIGPDVDEFKIGDLVIPCYIPQCNDCKFCKNKNTNLCSKIRATQGQGLMPDGTVRFRCNGQDIFHYMGTSCFSQYTVVADISLVKIHPSSPIEKVGLFGCGITTGYGAALNTAKITEGSSCAIWGCGCVGLSVIMGCKKSKAKQIIAIDICDWKLELARKLGATHCINPNNLPTKSTKEEIIEMTDGGADFTFECVGNTKLMRDALESAHKGWGVSTIIGVASGLEEISTRPFQLVTGRTWKGCAFGGYRSKDSVPELVKLCVDNEINIDSMITQKLSLTDINEAFKLMKSGER